jgi:hypothetical protein
MMYGIMLLVLTVCGDGQQSSEKSSQQSSAETAKVDQKLHEDVVQLVELSGVRQRMVNAIPQLMKDGEARLMAGCEGCNPEFGHEWARRMRARLKVDDFVDVYIRGYEKYLTDDDVNQLIALQKGQKDSAPPTPSPELRDKLTSVMPSVQSEIMGGCTQIGAKLGGEIEIQIRKEHPEYFKASRPQERQ